MTGDTSRHASPQGGSARLIPVETALRDILALMTRGGVSAQRDRIHGHHDLANRHLRSRGPAASGRRGGRRAVMLPGCDFAFRDAVRQLHGLGPRPTGELLGEVMLAVPGAAPVIAERL